MHASSRLANCLLRYTNIPTKGGNAKIVAYRYCLPGKYCLMTEHSRRLYNKLFTYTTRTAIKVHVHVDTPLKVILKKRSQLTALPPPPNHPTFQYKKLGGDQGIGLDQKQELWYDKEQLTFLTDFWEAESGWTLQVNIVWVCQSAQALQLILTQVLVPSTLVWWDRETYASTLSLLVHTIQAVRRTTSASHAPFEERERVIFLSLCKGHGLRTKSHDLGYLSSLANAHFHMTVLSDHQDLTCILTLLVFSERCAGTRLINKPLTTER